MDDFKRLEFVEGNITPSDIGWVRTENTPNWVISNNYAYWTMSPTSDASSTVWSVFSYSGLGANFVDGTYMMHVVHPVITLKKSALK